MEKTKILSKKENSDKMSESCSSDSNLAKDDEDLISSPKSTKDNKNKKDIDKDNNSDDSSENENPIILLYKKRIKNNASFNNKIFSDDEMIKKKKKKELTTFQKSYILNQKEEFNKNFSILKSDFIFLEDYEKKIFKDTNLDLMVIMDLTGSMNIWLNEVKENIKNIIEEIIENNPGSKIRVSFVGYRDFIEPKAPRTYYSKEFTENINEINEYINSLNCAGGWDIPEDIVGALKHALNMKWESEAKYAILVCDAPCHGKQYHDIFYDKFEKGDPEGTTLEYIMEQFRLKDITFYCLEIHRYTQKMFNIMKNVYNNDKKFHVEKLTDSVQFSFFVAFSASMILNNEKYGKYRFKNIIEKYRKESIESIVKKYLNNNNGIYNINNNEIDLIGQIENLQIGGEDKKLLDFVNRMNDLNVNDSNNNDNNMIDLNNNNNDTINIKLNREIFKNIENKKINYIIRSITYNKGSSIIYDWLNPTIKYNEFETNINIFPYIFNENIYNNEYNITIYDNILKKQKNCIIPFNIKKEYYNDYQSYIKQLFYDELICSQICDYFNILLKEKLPEQKQFLKFQRHIIYELNIKEKNQDTINLINEEFCNNFKYIISEDTILMNSKEIFDKRILQTFSHFSYQISGGQLLITDLEYDMGYINKYKIYKIKDGGYKEIMEFFASHICNHTCKIFELIHPRKKINFTIKDEFFSEKYLTKIRLCECCNIPLKEYEKIICDSCILEKQKIQNDCNTLCKKCSNNFSFSSYIYHCKLENYPKYCEKCRNFLCF